MNKRLDNLSINRKKLIIVDINDYQKGWIVTLISKINPLKAVFVHKYNAKEVFSLDVQTLIISDV